MVCCGTEDGELTVFCINKIKILFQTRRPNTLINVVRIYENRLIAGSSGGCDIFDITSTLLVFSTSTQLRVL